VFGSFRRVLRQFHGHVLFIRPHIDPRCSPPSFGIQTRGFSGTNTSLFAGAWVDRLRRRAARLTRDLAVKLIVQLHRRTKDEKDYGYLRAYVIEGNRKGRNLLTGMHYTGIEAAKREVKRELMPDAQITFEGPEGNEEVHPSAPTPPVALVGNDLRSGLAASRLAIDVVRRLASRGDRILVGARVHVDRLLLDIRPSCGAALVANASLRDGELEPRGRHRSARGPRSHQD
jgi:hypothetical protein